MAFAENLRYIMDTQQINQAQLARDAGLSTAGVNHLYAGEVKWPRSATLTALCKALHCTEDDLMGRELPLHIRRWAPNAETCERKLTEHLQSDIEPQPDMVNNMAVVARMQAKETEVKQPAALLLSDLQALFDACMDDFSPSDAIAQFGKQVYQLMVENRKENTK